ncbi:MAG: hypothetical protein KBC91_00100 [Candidatus Omnitrophica bacterium]|nr:hypothetical protein [Candidatus Omnitrophota bacterium]
MKRSKSSAINPAFWVLALILLTMARPAAAEEFSEPLDLPVTQEWMLKALTTIEERLSVIEANQEKILEGQKKLSEEHTQLRYWIHRN